MMRLIKAPMSALAVGAAFGAVSSELTAASYKSVDIESRSYTTSGWSVIEVIGVLVESGWAWAGLAVFTGWLVTRSQETRPQALARGVAAGALALLAAVAAYSVADTIRDHYPFFSFYESEPLMWWVISVLCGGPLGFVGACARRPGMIGLLAKLTVPIGAASQMVLLPPGRNEVITTAGQIIVGTVAAASIAFIVARFLSMRRHRPSQTGAQLP